MLFGSLKEFVLVMLAICTIALNIHSYPDFLVIKGQEALSDVLKMILVVVVWSFFTRKRDRRFAVWAGGQCDQCQIASQLQGKRIKCTHDPRTTPWR